MKVVKATTEDGFTATVIADEGQIGYYWQNEYGFFASPRNDPFQHVPVDSEEAALDLIQRFGSVQPGQTPFLTL